MVTDSWTKKKKFIISKVRNFVFPIEFWIGCITEGEVELDEEDDYNYKEINVSSIDYNNYIQAI